MMHMHLLYHNSTTETCYMLALQSPISGYVRDVLHWPPAAQQIDFKVASLAFKTLNGQAPSYLIDLTVSSALASCRPGLHSSSEIRLVNPIHSKKYAESAFVVACHLTWNRLPQIVHEFYFLPIFCQ